MSLRTAEQMLVTSYDDEGRARTSLEQVAVIDDGLVGYWLSDDRGVRERFPEDCVVSIRAATTRGRPILEEPVIEGRASVVGQGPDFDRVAAAIHDRYGGRTWFGSALERARKIVGRRTAECVVLIHLLG